jgi:hypothetical protein
LAVSKFVSAKNCATCKEELRGDIREIKDNHLAHLKGDIGSVKTDVQRVDEKLDLITQGQEQLLTILRGDPKNRADSGLVGDVEELKKNNKIIYFIISAIGIPLLLLILKTYVFKG